MTVFLQVAHCALRDAQFCFLCTLCTVQAMCNSLFPLISPLHQILISTALTYCPRVHAMLAHIASRGQDRYFFD